MKEVLYEDQKLFQEVLQLFQQLSFCCDIMRTKLSSVNINNSHEKRSMKVSLIESFFAKVSLLKLFC